MASSPLAYFDGCANDNQKALQALLRRKDERIRALETKNAMLTLQLAKVRGSLQSCQCARNHIRRLYRQDRESQEVLRQRLHEQSVTIEKLRSDIDNMRDNIRELPRQMQLRLNEMRQVTEEATSQWMRRVHDQHVGVNQALHDQLLVNERTVNMCREQFEIERRRRKELHNALVELRGNIRVHCRIRPVLMFDTGHPSSDINSSTEEIVSVVDDMSLCVQTRKTQLRGDVALSSKIFEFDRVYAPHEGQDAVFSEIQPLLTSLLDGYNLCLMAYGQTGSGKTYSMLGGELEHRSIEKDFSQDTFLGEASQGLIPRAVREVFRLIGERFDIQLSAQVAVMEIYNNEIHDLLQGGSPKCYLAPGEDDPTPGLKRHHVKNVDDVMRHVCNGLKRRAEVSTLVHEHSSRSHLVVTLSLLMPASNTQDTSFHHSRSPFLGEDHSPRATPPPSPGLRSKIIRSVSCPSPATPPRTDLSQRHAMSLHTASASEMGQTVFARLQLVDLAGSECVGMSGAEGAARLEASFINRSLSALADVLDALAKKKAHIPYRNSKLTHLLQDSIGGDAKLLVLTCVSPTQRYLTESMQCLHFGSRIRQVQRGPAPRKQAHRQNSSGGHSSGRDSPRLLHSR